MLDSGDDATDTYNPTLIIEGLSLSTVCGPSSTKITAPTISDLNHASELGQSAVSTATFENSNDECPITSISLDSESEDAGFTIESNGGEFTVTLNKEKSTTVG